MNYAMNYIQVKQTSPLQELNRIRAVSAGDSPDITNKNIEVKELVTQDNSSPKARESYWS